MGFRRDLLELSPLIVILLTQLIMISAANLSQLPNVSVSVDGDNGMGFAITGRDGVFIISSGLGAGNYTVYINHEGYVSKMLNTTVAAGGETDLGDIDLKVSGKIQGLVKSPSGNPVLGIHVMCQDESNNNTIDYAITLADGSFWFGTDIKNGTYTIQALVPGDFGPDGHAGYVSNMITGIGATEGQTTSGVIVELKPSGTILGTVKDKSDVSIANVGISVNQQDGFDPLFYGGFALTDSKGAYSIGSNLPSGTYEVRITEAIGFVYSYADYQNATVTAGQNTTVNFALDHSGIISGNVNLTDGDPAPRTTVSAFSSDFKYYGSAETDDNGLYRIESGLGTGLYTVIANNDYMNAKVVNVTAGAETVNVDFQIAALRSVAWAKGTVTDSLGSPLLSASLEAVAEGVFVGSGVEYDGTYTLEIELPEGQNSTQVNVTASAKGYFSSTQNVTVTSGQTTGPVDFALQAMPSGTLTGRIVAVAPETSRTVGVSVGNSFNYTMTFGWSSSEANATLPPYLQSLNDTEWISTSIVGVSGSTVTGHMRWHFKNGTDLIQGGIADIDTGSGNLTYWVIAANLNPNDTVYAPSTDRVINETMVRTYPDGTRNTNHLNVATEYNTTDLYQHTSENYYWDKSTGVMVEMSTHMVTQTNVSQMNVSATLTIAESNVWVVPEFPTWTSIPLILTVLTIAIICVKRRMPRTLIDIKQIVH
jgi:hypothetical protein